MDIQIVQVTRDTECGFCYARLDEIQKPRALPSGDIHCTDCIIIINYQDKTIECIVCKWVVIMIFGSGFSNDDNVQ